jgi:hypothetical protein
MIVIFYCLFISFPSTEEVVGIESVANRNGEVFPWGQGLAEKRGEGSAVSRTPEADHCQSEEGQHLKKKLFLDSENQKQSGPEHGVGNNSLEIHLYSLPCTRCMIISKLFNPLEPILLYLK